MCALAIPRSRFNVQTAIIITFEQSPFWTYRNELTGKRRILATHASTISHRHTINSMRSVRLCLCVCVSVKEREHAKNYKTPETWQQYNKQPNNGNETSATITTTNGRYILQSTTDVDMTWGCVIGKLDVRRLFWYLCKVFANYHNYQHQFSMNCSGCLFVLCAKWQDNDDDVDNYGWAEFTRIFADP